MKRPSIPLATSLLALALLTAAPGPAAAELSERWQKMNQPVEPFHILGNLYYVGANSVTAFLITTPEGHILIDGGFEETVPLITDGIEKLGFDIEDVEILLNSHAHFDHAGGLARLQELSGARFLASERDAPILERGGLGDDLLGDEGAFTPIEVDRRLQDGDLVEHGGMRLTAHVTAGHTRGCTSWAFEVEDAGRRHLAVSICSLSVLPGMRFHAEPTYPGIADDFERSFARLESLPCDLFLASHAGFFRLADKLERMGEEGPNPFLDREGYLRYVERARERFEKAVAEDAAAGPPTLTIETVADGVFAFRPTDEAQAIWRAVSNSGAVVLDDGVLIFDSHWTPRHVKEAGALLYRQTGKPIRWVVHSHYHADHTGGASAYPGDVERITHHATRERLARYYAELPDKLPAQIAHFEEQLAAATSPEEKARAENLLRYGRDLQTRLEGGEPAPLATLTFEEKVVLHRGRAVEVHFLGRGHTDGDAVVFLPEEKVAFVGDLLWVRMLPNVSDGFTGEWIATLEKVLALGATRFVPGHGAIAGVEEVREQIAFLRWLRAAVEPFARAGAGAEAAKAGIELPERYADYLFGWHLAPAVEKVYGELTEGTGADALE